MNVKRTEPGFGMAVIRDPRTPKVNTYIDKMLSKRSRTAYDKIVVAEVKNPIDVYVSVHKNDNKYKFVSEVGGKTFEENFFFGPIATLKRAVKYARKQHMEQKKINDSWGKGDIRVSLD